MTTTAAPKRRELTGDDLFGLIGQLTDPRREVSTQPTPSLWDLLIGNTARAAGQGSAIQRSRPPVSTQSLSLIHEIRSACEQRLRTAGRQPIIRSRTLSDATREMVRARPDSTVLELWRDIPAELRAINAITKDRPVERAGWAERVQGWVHRAEAALGLTPPRIQLPRGTRCLDCKKAWVVVDEGGEQVRHPAVHLVWGPSGSVHYIACSACGSSRWPYDLHALAKLNEELNEHSETLSAGDDDQKSAI